MNRQLVGGVIIPFVFVLILITLSSFGPNFEVNHAVVDSIKLTDLQSAHPIKLEAISIKNQFFMPRKYSLPNFIVCSDKGQFLPLSYQPKRIYSDRTSFDLAAYEQKTVQIYISTYKKFNASELNLIQTEDGLCDTYFPEEIIKTIKVIQ